METAKKKSKVTGGEFVLVLIIALGLGGFIWFMYSRKKGTTTTPTTEVATNLPAYSAPSPAPAPSQAEPTGFPLKYGSNNNQVKVFQTGLNMFINWYITQYPAKKQNVLSKLNNGKLLSVDGDWGPSTQKAAELVGQTSLSQAEYSAGVQSLVNGGIANSQTNAIVLKWFNNIKVNTLAGGIKYPAKMIALK